MNGATEPKGPAAVVLKTGEAPTAAPAGEKSKADILCLHYPWAPEALEMVNEMEERYRVEMIRDAEVCAKCMGESEVTPVSIREARCWHLDD